MQYARSRQLASILSHHKTARRPRDGDSPWQNVRFAGIKNIDKTVRNGLDLNLYILPNVAKFFDYGIIGTFPNCKVVLER